MTDVQHDAVQGRAAPAIPVEEEVITEENVYDRPDETMGFFPGQVLRDGYVSTVLLIACCVLSYVAPAPLTAPAVRKASMPRARRASGSRARP